MTYYLLKSDQTKTFDLGWDIKHGCHVNVFPYWDRDEDERDVAYSEIPDRFRSEVHRSTSMSHAFKIWWFWSTGQFQHAYRLVNAIEHVHSTPFPHEIPDEKELS